MVLMNNDTVIVIEILTLILELPGPPIIDISQDNVCFESASPPEFPVEYYELSISDVTGETKTYRQ